MKKVLVCLLSVILGCLSVSAKTCSSEETSKLKREADNVKVNYEVIEENIKYETVDGEEFNQDVFETEGITEKIRITVYNITNNLFVLQTNDRDNEKITINYSDTKNGNYSFDTTDINSLMNYKFVVYSNLDCDLMELKTIDFVKPMRNSYYDYEVCQSHLDVPVCAKYISSELEVSEASLYDYVTNYKVSKGTPTIISRIDELGETNLFRSNWMYFAIGGVVVIGVAIYIVIVKKRSN